MRVASEKRFGVTVDDYDRHRPSYPSPAIDWIVENSGISRGGAIVDLGCGTGIASRLFAERGFDVVGVEVNDAMLARARARGGPSGLRFVRGRANDTGLPRATFDLAVAAQAFHWFDVDATLAELARIVRPTGAAAAFWNVRTSTPTMDAYDALLSHWSREYAELKKPAATLDDLRAAVGARFCEASFPNAQRFDWGSFRGRVFSSSYVPHGVDDKVEFERALRVFFDAHATQNELDFQYETKIFLWKMHA